jgi:5-methylcytosine-specific restriction endonuclease McrA
VQLPPRQCSGCPNLNCSVHTNAKAYDQARRDEYSRGVYRSTRWRRLRLIVLSRDLICQACHLEAATVADHKVPIERGGDVWSLDNLQGLCFGCHTIKTNRERGG